MAELIFPRRPGERISHDSHSSDAAKAWCDRSECAFRSVVRPCSARALRAGLVLVSALGALSVAAGNARGQPTVVCRFVSWDLHVIWPDYSVDGLPGMVEQSGKLPVVMKLPLS